MPPMLSRTTDIVLNGRAHRASDDPTQPIIIPDTMPQIIKDRFAQAQRIDTRADWKELARLCGATALGFFQDHDYNPNDADFRRLCQLARIAYLRSMNCLVQGVSMPRPSRVRVGL